MSLKSMPQYPEFRTIQVPEVNYQKLSWGKWVGQKIRRFLIPTTSDDFQYKVHYFREEFRDSVREYNEVRKGLKQLFLVHRSHRLSLLQNLTNTLNVGVPPEQWDSDFDNVEICLKSFVGAKDGVQPGVNSQTMREYSVLDIVPSSFTSGFDNQPVERSAQLSPSETTLLNEYCESIKQSKTLRAHLFTGLVYSTVFGATRGDVKLMCYVFPFFSLGFMVPVIVQIGLRWAAGLQKEVKFASQQIWTVVIAAFLFMSSVAVMAAITILNLTIFFLNPDINATTDANTNGTTDIPGIIAFAISGSIFVVILLAVLLSAIATKVLSTMSGFKAMIAAMYGAQSHDQDALKNYMPV
ncbi:hypothetical protein K435DRAFT_842592 [Dendrothele bispora CBS 962.96]|uniref:Uncharacterized protein n=1 Tax=Dendrothele bispora (strain CBS 962.96) TaxID=1314807 RepID=A0A4S8LEA7_DENBC|nr:hypothetical protein K435DRAFT_842592 [Dendrothele bispora CBS 962.96]